MLQPYQRLWDDVVTQIGRLASWGMSLRHMQDMIGEQAHTSVGLSTLNRIVQYRPAPVELTLTSVPPVVLLDAIWVTLLEDGTGLQTDACGRQRRHKHQVKVCVLVALGIYPQNGRWGILSWTLAAGETQAAWEALLVALDTRGLYRQRGLELLIHDGGRGLVAALKQVYPHIPHQRCLFHKLRNLRQAIVPPADLPRRERRAFKTALMHLISPIFEASDEHHARILTDDFADRFQTAQPRLVALLHQDWADNFAFLRVLAHFPDWQRRYLRTTSLLERVNRMIRRLFRSAGAFHSRSGLCAAVTRVLAPHRLI
jgi:transposase-like protein